jgi:hypothetical protein
MEPEDMIDNEEDTILECYYCGVEFVARYGVDSDVDDHPYCGYCDPEEEKKDQAMWDAADEHYKRKIEGDI